MTVTLNPINVSKINNTNPELDFHLYIFTMALSRVVVKILCIALVDALVIEHDNTSFNSSDRLKSDLVAKENGDLNDAFKGVYSECFLHLSYTCLQRKTLHYLRELDRLNEISVIGDYIKFVKLNNSGDIGNGDVEESSLKTAEELSNMIDKAVDNFFNNHLIRFSALGKDVLVPHTVEEFVGRKRRKGGGGGHGGGDGDGGKKKMMMMAMMCMKMKLMMMVPAMMGMMGMMSFKGMMFSMMSFMISKMMLLMKILEKKGGGGAGGSGGGDGGWAASGGGGAWMPAGGQDYGGGGGGGYDSNAQWSSRSILEKEKPKPNIKPVITYIKPIVRYNNPVDMNPFTLKNLNDEVIKANNKLDEPKSRRKRGLIDALQSVYLYWTSKVLGLNYKQKRGNYPKYKIVNGMKYVYYPIRQVPKVKAPKELPVNTKVVDDAKPVVITDFNKGEIVENVEGRMNRRKFHKMNENVNETVDDNPWE